MALNSFDGSGQVIPDFEAYASTCFQCFGSHLDDRYPRISARWIERCLRGCFMERWLRGECMGWLALQFQGLASTVAKQRTSWTPAWDVVQVDATRFNTSESGNASLMWLNSISWTKHVLCIKKCNPWPILLQVQRAALPLIAFNSHMLYCWNALLAWEKDQHLQHHIVWLRLFGLPCYGLRS